MTFDTLVGAATVVGTVVTVIALLIQIEKRWPGRLGTSIVFLIISAIIWGAIWTILWVFLGSFAGTAGSFATPKDWAIVGAFAGAVSVTIERVIYFARDKKHKLILVLIGGVVFGAIFGGLAGYSFGIIDQLYDGWIAGAIFGLLLGATWGFVVGFFLKEAEETHDTHEPAVLLSRAVFGGILGAFAGQVGGAFGGPIGAAIVGSICLVIAQMVNWCVIRISLPPS